MCVCVYQTSFTDNQHLSPAIPINYYCLPQAFIAESTYI